MAKDKGFTVKDLMDTVKIKNRVVDAPVVIVHNKEEYAFGPGEVKSMPRKLAQWMLRKGWYKWIAANTALGRKAQILNKLVILGTGKDETDLHVQDTEALTLVPITKIDPATGKPLRMVAINPGDTGADTAEMALMERDRQVNAKLREAVTNDVAEKITRSAQENGIDTDEKMAEAVQRAGFKPNTGASA
jgi:hypothetical protein